MIFDEQTAGALLIDKPAGISSFGVIESLQRTLREKTGLKKSALPKFGHGGTLDPFATGLLVVCVGRGVKLAQYFLGSEKGYEALVRFGETTASGDLTDPVTETSTEIPTSISEIRAAAAAFTQNTYLQMPPMHSAKKVDGKPLYELARQGKEIERDAKACILPEFSVIEYTVPRAKVFVRCSAGTYIRTLAQDWGRSLGTVAMLDELRRTASGTFRLNRAITLAQVNESILAGVALSALPNWLSFDTLLDGYPRATATEIEADAILHGRQAVLLPLMLRAFAGLPAPSSMVPIYLGSRLIAIGRRSDLTSVWELEKTFP